MQKIESYCDKCGELIENFTEEKNQVVLYSSGVFDVKGKFRGKYRQKFQLCVYHMKEFEYGLIELQK